MALQDDDTLIIFVVVDVCMVSNEDALDFRKAVTDRLGMECLRNVIISATHTHSGPSTMPVFGQSKNESYRAILMEGILESAEKVYGSVSSHKNPFYYTGTSLNDP